MTKEEIEKLAEKEFPEKEPYPTRSARSCKRIGFIAGFTARDKQVNEEMVGFVNWLEDNGYNAVWSNKYKLRRWTDEPVLINGSAEHFDNHVKNGMDLPDLLTIFKQSKEGK